MTSVHNPRNFRWNTDSAIYVRLNVPTHFHVESNFTVICHFLFALLWFKVALFSALKITNSHFYCVIPHLKHFTLPRIGFLSWVLVSADVVVQVQVSHRRNTFFVFLLLLIMSLLMTCGARIDIIWSTTSMTMKMVNQVEGALKSVGQSTHDLLSLTLWLPQSCSTFTKLWRRNLIPDLDLTHNRVIFEVGM